ncbi:hypothetical protein LH464_24460, partial [Neorhizobium sp. T786]|uniref:contractile injection system protein, VgrG/Pvc8 family n=1 Tax=Pseudorhizobium xiangyangii TaxID=2883104 RepID=UPI0021080829
DDKGRHTIILCDRPEILPACRGQETLAYNAMASGAVKGVYCSSLLFREKLRATTFVQRDYTFKAPAAHMEHKYKPSILNGAKGDYELFDYPGRFKEEATGNAFTRHKLEAARVDASIAHGIANAPLLVAGHGMTLSDHPSEALNRRWRLLTIRHEGVQPQAFAEDGIGDLATGPALIPPSLADAETTGSIFGLTSSTSPGLLAATLRRDLDIAASSTGGEASSATLYACA